MQKKLALVIHGIGEQSAGETVFKLAGGLVGDQSRNVKSDRIAFQDNDGDPDAGEAELFPTYVQRITHDTGELVMAEVYWADLSTVRQGRFQIILDFVEMILGLGHIVRKNRDEFYPETAKGIVPSLIRKMTELFIVIFQSVLVPLNIITAVFISLLYAIGSFQQFFLRLEEPWAGTVHSAGLATTVVMLGLSLFFLSHARDTLYSIFAKGCLWCSAILPAVVLFVYLADLPDETGSSFLNATIRCWPNAQSVEMAKISCDAIQYAVVMTGLILIASLLLAVFLLIAAILHWGQLYFWKSLKERAARAGIEDPSTLTDAHYSNLGWSRSLFVSAQNLIFVLFTLTALTVWVAFFQLIDGLPQTLVLSDWHVETLQRLAQMAALPYWLSLVSIVVGALMVLRARHKWHSEISKRRCSDAGGSGFAKEEEVPRMIVGNQIKAALGFSTVIIAAYLVWLVAQSRKILETSFIEGQLALRVQGQHTDALELPYVLQWSPEVATVLALGTILFFSTSQIGFRGLGTAVGVGKDIVGYFSVSRDNAGRLGYWDRERFNNRFRTVFHRLWNSENYDELVIVAHSQGTVIAVENIRNLPAEVLSKTRLVTMGSPTWHIYRYYFPHAFMQGTQKILGDFEPSGRRKKGKLKSWRNICRADDYVGTFVNDPRTNWPQNEYVDLRGHQGYWYDRAVRNLLVHEEFSELRTDKAEV